MSEVTQKEKAAEVAAKENLTSEIVSDADPIDQAVNELSLRAELECLDRVAIAVKKKDLASKYSLSAKEILECWKAVHSGSSEGGDSVKKTPAETLIESLSAKDPKEPWAENIEIAALLKETAQTLQEYISFKNEDQAYTCALWVLASWFADYVSFSPYLLISAPMKQCGKSQLLRCLSNLSRRSLLASNVSASVLFRMIEMAHPTVFIDEVDTFLKDNPELIGIINAGIERDGAKAYRNEKTATGEFVPTAFDCFAFKALSGISAKNISETITDRAIVIELQRKPRSEVKKKVREAGPDCWINLKRKFLKAVEQYSDDVKQAKPYIPEYLSDRDGDKWSSLFAIADLAQDQRVSDYFRQAARALKFKDEDSISVSYELLKDIRDIFERGGGENGKISTKDLIDKLIEDEDLAWRTWNRGNPLTPKQLANRLKDFDIRPTKYKNFGRDCRGYLIKDFEDAFSRYLSG